MGDDGNYFLNFPLPGNNGVPYWDEIRFVNPEEPEVTQLKAKFLRVPADGIGKSGFNDGLINFMCGEDKWDMPKPRILIEVTGGAQLEISADHAAVETLRKGIIIAAKQSDAWIVSGGSNKGVMALVGNEATQARRIDPYSTITCLGIAAWCCVRNNNVLTKRTETKNKQEPISYRMDMKPKSDDVAPLNSGHNYFLLVDDGRKEGEWGADVPFGSNFIAYLAKNPPWDARKEGDFIPVVLVAIGGGGNTLHKIHNACGSKTPVVILTGFGGVTEILADLIRLQKENPNCNQTELEEWARKNPIFQDRVVKKPIDKAEEERNRTYSKMFASCVASGMVTVVNDFESQKTATPEQLSEALLNVIFKQPASDDKLEEKLGRVPAMIDIARRWNRIESARLILQNCQEKIEDLQQLKDKFRPILFDALSSGQHEFISLFDNFRVFPTAELLSAENIPLIYDNLLFSVNKNLSKEFELVTRLLQQAFDRKDMQSVQVELKLSKTGEMVADWIGCYVGNIFQKYQSRLGGNAAQVQVEAETLAHADLQQNHITGFRDMFLLALITSNEELAIYLWRNGKDLIGTALVAAILLRNLSDSANDELFAPLAKTYEDRAKEWQERAKAVLTKVDETHNYRVTWVLMRNLRTWQNRSVLDLVYFGQERSFAAHPAVVDKITNVWHGRILATSFSPLIYLAGVFPLTLVRLLEFIPEDPSSKREAKTESHQETTETGLTGCVVYSHRRVGPEREKPLKKQNSVHRILTPSYSSFFSWSDDLSKGIIPICRAQWEVYASCMIKWFWHTIFNFTFLLLFTSFILTGTLDPDNVWTITFQVLEGVVVAWAACILLDIAHETMAEGAALAAQETSPFRMFRRTALNDRFKFWKWRKVDFYSVYIPIFIALLLITALVIRCSVSKNDYVYARTLYALACWLFWIRSTKLFHASRAVGIYVVVLSELLPTIFYFLLVYASLLVSFAVPIYALIVPTLNGRNAYNGTMTDFVQLFAKVVYNRWWNLVQADLDNSRAVVEGVCTNYSESLEDDAKKPQPLPFLRRVYDSKGNCEKEFNFVAVVLFVVFVFMTNIVWMNVLIASLSKRVEDIMSEANELNEFNSMTTVRTYYHKTILPPPINIVEIFVKCCIFVHQARKKKMEFKDNDFVEHYNKSDTHLDLDAIERDAADRVLADEAIAKAKSKALADLEKLLLDTKLHVDDKMNGLKEWLVENKTHLKTGRLSG